MDIVVVGRHTEVSERFRSHVEDRLGKIEQTVPSAHRIDVEVTHERNPRQADSAERVELTVRGRGPVVRAEASASDRYAAFDSAADKLIERLRRAKDRRLDRARSGARAGIELAEELPPEPVPAAPPATTETAAQPADDDNAEVTVVSTGDAVERMLGDSPVVIREKVHQAAPMSVEDALNEMELVGHPFFLFVDAQSAQPSVIYRRHGWTYGVIRLDVPS